MSRSIIPKPEPPIDTLWQGLAKDAYLEANVLALQAQFTVAHFATRRHG